MPKTVDILIFKSHAGKAIHIVPDDLDNIDMVIKKVAKHIKAAIDNIEIQSDIYHTHINKDICCQFESDILSDLLSKVNKKFNQSRPSF